MNLDMRLDQGQALSQQLNLAPQLLNWLRLLQCPTTELSAMVAHELESNPAIEADDEPGDTPTDSEPVEEPDWATEPDSSDASPTNEQEDAILDAKIEFLSEVENEWKYDSQHGTEGGSREEQSEKMQFIMDSIVAGNSLQEHLLKQLSTFHFSQADQILAEFIIGSLDERGYLVTPLVELAELTGEQPKRLEQVLTHVQTLDPAGVGARDLRECLLLQLNPSLPNQALAYRLVKDHLEDLAEKNHEAIAATLHVGSEDLAEAAELVVTLDPQPGMAFSGKAVEYITPDLTVSPSNGSFVIELNDEHVPRLRISASCRSLLAQKTLSAEDRAYVRNKLRTASFLIQGISQRQETLKKVTREIVRVQREFFAREDGELKPLTMAKVASVIGVHETTVSRALASKYIDTPRGVFEMKHFFRSGYLCSDGSAMTPEAVKAMISDMIAGETEMMPLTDLEIVNSLKEKGLHLARRTIAKYRDEIGIPASKERKKSARQNARMVHIREHLPGSRSSRTNVSAFPSRALAAGA